MKLRMEILEAWSGFSHPKMVIFDKGFPRGEILLGCLDSQFTDYDHIQSQKILYNHQPSGGLQPLPRYQENMVGHPQSLGLKCWAPGLSLDAKNPSRSWAKFTFFIP